MMNLFEFSVNVIEEIIILSFFYLYLGCKYKGIKKILSFLLGVAVDVTALTLINMACLFEGILLWLLILIDFIHACIFLKGNFYLKLFMSSFINCLVSFIAIFSIILISVILNVSNDQIYGMTKIRVIVIFVTKAILIIACVILLKFKFNYIAQKRSAFIFIVTLFVADISLISIMELFLKFNELKNELLLASISVILVNALTYYLIIQTNKDIETETKLNAVQQQYEYDKQRAKEIEELYSKTCGIRHDLLHHFTTLDNFLDTDIDKAKEYVKTVTKNQVDEIRRLIKTDNCCFDAIANTKITQCDKLGIKTQTRIMKNALEKLDDDEIAIIFGNLFDNAIEASKDSKEKSIELDVQVQDQYLSIMMSNSIDKSVLRNNKNLTTTKPNKKLHGFGIKNIKRIVDKHGGMINYFEENGFFCCDIYI